VDGPYEDSDFATETVGPRWECPDDTCTCEQGPPAEDDVELTVRLLAPNGEPMPAAICRIRHRGRVVNQDQPQADDEGWVTAKVSHAPSSVEIEWAPPQAPPEPGYPYRRRYYVDLGRERDEGLKRRLAFPNQGCIGEVTTYAERVAVSIHTAMTHSGIQTPRLLGTPGKIWAIADRMDTWVCCCQFSRQRQTYTEALHPLQEWGGTMRPPLRRLPSVVQAQEGTRRAGFGNREPNSIFGGLRIEREPGTVGGTQNAAPT